MALSYQNYTGDNATTQFSIPFTYQDTSEISVTVDGVAETGLTFPSSSTVLLTSPPAIGTLVQVRRTTALASRAVDFASGSVLTEEDLDDSNIQVFHAAQEAIDIAGDSIFLDTDDKWEANNKVIKNVGTPIANTDGATKAYADGISSAAASAAVAAANAAVTAATGAIIPDATKIVLHPINTQYTLSDGITTDFSAKHYANVASTNAGLTAADLVLTNADVVSANAAVTAAENARDVTLAAYDNFDDRYLGVFTTALQPVVDNDGNALVAGSLYFNSTDGAMKVYTGSLWVAAYVSGVGFLASASNLSDVADAATSIANIGGLPTAGGTMTGDINFGDNVKANFGAGSDLQIYHDSTNSYVDDAGQGALFLRGNQVVIGKYTGDFMVNATADHAVQLYYDNAEKLATTATGVTITGTAVATTQTASVTGSTTLNFAANQNFVLTLTGAVTLDNPTTEQVGQSGFITFIQGGSGSYTVSLGTDYETAAGAGLTLSTAVGSTDIVPYVVAASGRILLGTPQLAFA
jgi:hypothetical protein